LYSACVRLSISDSRCARIDLAGTTLPMLFCDTRARHSRSFQVLHLRFDLQYWPLCTLRLPFEFVSFFSNHFVIFFWLSQCTLRVCACPSPIRDARGWVLLARLYLCSLRHARARHSR
jgi:hypothetical protein